MRSRALPHVIALSLFLLLANSEARAGLAVPPVPFKKHPAAPREGFSKARLRVSHPETGEGARAPLAANAVYNVLAIRVAFSDTPIESSTAYYDRLLLFQKQYWEQVTEGQVTVNPTLADSVFTLSRPMAYYGDDDHFAERLVFMVRDLVQLADSTVDFSPYQSLVIFHAGRGQEADVNDDSREQLWSAFITKQDFEAILPDSSGAVGIRTNDPIGVGVYKYIDEAVELPEAVSQDGYVFGMTGVICHEFGHQLGLPDLYDTNGDEGGSTQGVGAWDVMGTGVWNFNGFAPAELSSWSRTFLGLIAPQRVVSDQEVALSMLEQQVEALPRIVRIPMTQTEYLLLENRRQDRNGNGRFDFDDANGNGQFDFYVDSYAGAEFDYFLPGDGSGSGILIYHVDDATIAAYLEENLVNSFEGRKGVDVVEADGIEDLDGPPSPFSSGSPDDVFRAGWRDKLTPTTTPSSAAYGNAPTGISITEISAPDSIMTFSVAFARDKPGWPKMLSGRIGSAPALAVDLDGAGPPFSQELIVPVQRLNNTGALYVFRADGTDYLDGDATPTPFATTQSRPISGPCVGDIDGVPGNEIVFSTLNGTIYAFHADGTEVLDGDANPLTIGVVVAASATSVHAQPVLGELDGTPGLEIVVGGPESGLGFSFLRAIRVAGGTVESYTIPTGGSSEAPPVIADVNGDGTNEVIASVRATSEGELRLSGLYYASWQTFTDPILLPDPENVPLYAVVTGGPFSAPVATDLDRDGTHEILVADLQASFHAYRFVEGTHIPGDPPSSYVTRTELPGWPAPFPGAAKGSLAELSLGDLERDGHPELFQTGDRVRVAATHWSGSPRSGFPIAPGDPLAPADSEGTWSPLIADADGDGSLDVIPVLPDGRRPAYRGNGQPIPGFVELGSTGVGAPPILADLEGDGLAEWIETFDADVQVQVSVRDPILPVQAASVAWGQYRLHPTRNAVLTPGPAAPGGGTQTLADVYVYPNPARGGESRVHYRLADDATSVSIRIYDSAGTLVADLPTGPADRLGASEHSVTWNNRSSASGIYLCRIEVHSSAGTEVRFATLGVVR